MGELRPSMIAVVAAALLAASCSGRMGRMATHPAGPGGAAAAGVAAAPGMIAAPFGPGLPDLDREAELAPPSRIEAAPALVAATSTTNVKLTQIPGQPEAETTIAVNPANPLNIVAGSIASPNCDFYTSLDGGMTWMQGALPIPSGYTSLGDPAVTFCGDGSAYYSVLVLGASGGFEKSGVYVYRSTDGGLTWPTASAANERLSPFQEITDKPWITCDASGTAHDGTVYVEYSNPQRVACNGDMFCRGIKVVRSTDHGATWSIEAIVSDNPQSPQNQGALAVGPNGELYVAWDKVAVAGDLIGPVMVDKSTNGGATFGTDVIAFSSTEINPDPNFRRLSYPVMDADRSSGPYRGNVYIAISDARNGDPDILLVRSTDGGATWSAPVRVNDDPLGNGADQWAPGIAVDPLGRVIVTFSDRRRYAGTETYEVWGAISRDGGVTFDTNFLIGDTPSQVPAGVFLGDYDSVAATADHLYPTWADQRIPQPGETPDIYSDRYSNAFAYDEVRNVAWTGPTSMTFDTQDARFGVDLDYDVAGGLLSELRADAAFTRVGCVASLWPSPPFVDARVPPDGDGYYYLVRSHGASGVGTYGDGAPPARPNVRDPLDESLVTCP